MMIFVMSMMIFIMSMMMIINIGVKREGSNERFPISANLSSELTGTEDTLATKKAGKEELKEESWDYMSCDPPDNVLIIKGHNSSQADKCQMSH